MKKIRILICLSVQMLIQSVYSQSGNVLDFDGINDYVSIPHTSYFSISNSFTIECWIKPKSFSSLAGIVSKKNTNTSEGFTLRLSQTAPYTGIDFDGMTTPNAVLSSNQWYHIAAVNDNGVRYLYINGIKQILSGTPSSYNPSNKDIITLGADNIKGTPKYFKGALETVRIYYSAFDQSTVRKNMNNHTVIHSAQIMNFKFDEGIANGNNTGNTVLVNSKAGGSSLNGTLMNFSLNGNTSNWVDLTGWEPAPYQLYVNLNATGNNDGNSWQNAITNLTTALDMAYNGAILWIAKGTYKPEGNTFRGFLIPGGAKIYGGFAGNETLLQQRNWKTNETILSGNTGDINRNDDNYAVVVSYTGANKGSVLSGLTIRDAYSESTSSAGISITDLYSSHVSLTIEYCKILQNTGRGISINNLAYSDIDITINQCLIANNSGYSNTAINLQRLISSPPLTNQIKIVNCTIANNIPSALSAPLNFENALSQTPLKLTLQNCNIWGNGKSKAYSATNTNVVAEYSNIQGNGYSGTNIDTDPYFNNPSNDDFTISTACSPVVNAGTNSLALSFDLNHNPRINAGVNIIDMGAYEYQGPVSQTKFYIKPNGSGNKNGLSWENAMRTFPANTQDCKVQEVWVAAGTYKPTTDNDRNKSFFPLSGVKYYGGFSGNESLLEQRNWSLNKTILSGNIGNPDDSTDNTASVVRFLEVNANTLLDGFVIQEGYASDGGGVSASNLLNGQGSFPTLANCIITRNTATNIGGGIFNQSLYANYPAKITLINTAIYGNSAKVGGAISNFVVGGAALVKLINCTITENKASVRSGAILNASHYTNILAQDSILNSIIWGNIAPVSAGIENIGVGARIDAFYSNIQEMDTDENQNIISTDPQFINPTTHNYTPNPCNPSSDAGNVSYLLNSYAMSPMKDITGNQRIKAKIDMGAFEYVGPTQFSNLLPQLYVNKNANGKGNGASWKDAFTELSYLREIGCIKSNNIWLTRGIYMPTSGTDRSISFEFKNPMNLYGGFIGNESALESRNWVENPTILSGNIGNITTNTDNSHHVLTVKGIKLLLDGLIIQDGNTSGALAGINYEGQSGGGILVMANQDTTDVVVRNCMIRNNESGYAGGGIAHVGVRAVGPSSLKIYGTLLTSNIAPQGSAIFQYSVSSDTDTLVHSTQLVNCTISKNSSDLYGTGGIYYTSLGKKLRSEFNIYNSILWNNPSLYNEQIDMINSGNNLLIAHSNIQNNRFTGNNVLNLDPQFNANTFTLKENSPCRNIGNNSLATQAGLTKDLGFNDRLINLTVDLGAYEGSFLCFTNQNITQTFDNGTNNIQDGGVLTSTSKILPVSTTSFDAQRAVVLQPGFVVEGGGAVFTAQIGGCK